ncbi:MAG: hypothetical protein V8T22_01075 [Oscillospiraceae bacterium]
MHFSFISNIQTAYGAQIVFLEHQLSELIEQIANLLHDTNQYITTISGIGETIGAIIVSEIGDINRF